MWPLVALPFRPEVKNHSVTGFIHLLMASVVILMAVAAKSMPPTPPPVAETFVMVLVGFGRVWAANWRLPAMVGVVDVWF